VKHKPPSPSGLIGFPRRVIFISNGMAEEISEYGHAQDEPPELEKLSADG